jgi:integrase
LKNPLDEIKPPKSIAKKKEVLEIDEVNLFLSACPADQYALWSFVTLTGCRISEALGAKWANLDYDKSIFKVREVLVRTKTGKKFDEPKTVNSIRDVPLSSDLISILKKHKVEQNKRRLRVGSLWHDNDLIFPSRFGKPKSAVKCAEQLKKIVSDAGIKKNVSPHTLRHGFVTLAIDSGADIKTVSEMVGHSSVAITMQIYKQTKFSDKRTVATAMSDMILKWAKNVRTESNETVKSMTEKDENQPKPLKKAAETG